MKSGMLVDVLSKRPDVSSRSSVKDAETSRWTRFSKLAQRRTRSYSRSRVIRDSMRYAALADRPTRTMSSNRERQRVLLRAATSM